MKYLMLVWAGLWRKRARTVLTMLSVVVAFLLFGVLQSFNAGMSGIYKNLDAERLFVENAVTTSDGLPIAYLERLRETPGVQAVTHWTFFGAYFRDPRNTISIFATDIAAQFATSRKLKMPQDQYEAMLRTPNGIIISQRLALRNHWSIGDRIPLGSSIWPRKDGAAAYEFQVVGIMDLSQVGDATYPAAFIHYKYLDDLRSFANGIVQFYIVRVTDPRRANEIMSAVDAQFANSSYEAKAQTEQVWAQSQVQQVGDIQTITRSIVGAVLFTLLFLTANTMMQSVRERTPELAVLKTLGFSNAKVLALVMVESTLMCAGAAIAGLVLASMVFKGMSGLFGDVALPTAVVLSGLGMAVFLALLSGGPPALRAARLNIVDALAGR
jgi:putative ABC transport system permease protein